MPRIKSLSLLLLSMAFTTTAFAQEAKPYKDGPVVSISYIKTKNGKFDDYMKFLATDYKNVMEGYKKAGLITAYAVYSAQPRSPSEPDLILTTTYANMAALDRTDDFEKVDARITGSVATQNKASGDRDAIREVLGGELIRELILK